MIEWNQSFLALRPSAAKVFAIAWQKKAEGMLQERGAQTVNGEILRDAFKETVEKSSSLPVRDKLCKLLTLHCAMLLLANYHPYGKDVDKTIRPMGWSDSIWSRYLKMLHRHGMEMRIES